MTRIHLAIDETEKERFRQVAEQTGESLSSWLREAAREKLARETDRTRLDSLDDLRAFFAECDRREQGREPDWEKHRQVIDRSIRSGAAET